MSTDKVPLWRVLFLAEHYGRMILTLDEVAEQVGLAAGTIRNRRTRGEFAWLRTDGRQLTADVADVAAYIDHQHRTAAAEARNEGLAVHPPACPARPRRRPLGKS